MSYKNISSKVLSIFIPIKFVVKILVVILHFIVFKIVGGLFKFGMIRGRVAGKITYAILFVAVLSSFVFIVANIL